MFPTDDDLVSIFICESHLYLTASTWSWWALKVLTNQFNFGIVWVLSYTVSWINSCDSSSFLKHDVTAHVLPIDIILVDFNDGFTSKVGRCRGTSVLDV